MDRNTFLGLGLIFLIIVTFSYINQPSDEEIRKAKKEKDSLTIVQHQNDSIEKSIIASQKTEKKSDDSTSIAQSFGSLSSFTNGNIQYSFLENENLKIKLSNKGGRIVSVILKKHKKFDGSEVELFDENSSHFSYRFATADAKTISTNDLYFNPIVSQDKKSLRMQLMLDSNRYMEQVYALNDTAGLVDYKLNLVGFSSILSPNANYLDLECNISPLLQEKTKQAEERVATIWYKYASDQPDRISETKEASEDLKTPVQWISFKQQYFNASIIANEAFENASLQTKNSTDPRIVRDFSSTITFNLNRENTESKSMKFYFGPNQFKTLQTLNVELERIVTMGWGIFRWVNTYFVSNVFYFLSQYIFNFGIIILLLTILIKTILFPLVYRSYLSTAKMRLMKPEMDELKEKYGNDMARLQQENMKLYRKAGVNPFGGCIPMLLQLPILFAMFQFFPSAFELRGQSFLWASDLSTYDSIYTFGFSIPFYGDHISLFTLMMTVSSLVYTLMNNQATGVNEQMKWISYIMPIMFLGFFNNYASGLTYYYFLSNLVTIGQQLLIRRFVDEKSLHAQLQENKKKPMKKSRLQAKLEEMARSRGIDPDKLGK